MEDQVKQQNQPVEAPADSVSLKGPGATLLIIEMPKSICNGAVSKRAEWLRQYGFEEKDLTAAHITEIACVDLEKAVKVLENPFYFENPPEGEAAPVDRERNKRGRIVTYLRPDNSYSDIFFTLQLNFIHIGSFLCLD